MHTTKVIYVFVAAIGITGTGAVSLPGSAEPKISARQPDAWVSYNNCPAAGMSLLTIARCNSERHAEALILDCSTGQGPPRVLWADDGCNGPLAESTRGMFLDTMGNDAAWRGKSHHVALGIISVESSPESNTPVWFSSERI